MSSSLLALSARLGGLVRLAAGDTPTPAALRAANTLDRLAQSEAPRIAGAWQNAMACVRLALPARALEEALAAGNAGEALGLVSAALEQEAPTLEARWVASLERLATQAMGIAAQPVVAAVVAAEAAAPGTMADPPGAPGGVRPSLLVENARAAQWARQYGARLVVQVNDETREAIRGVVARTMAGTQEDPSKLTPGEAERHIRALVGLHDAQARAVDKLRADLEAEGVPPARVVREADRYTTRLRGARANLIARTESLMATSAGQEEVWGQAVAAGLVDPDTSMRQWQVADDDRLCPVCSSLDGQQVPLRERFTAAGGTTYLHPPAHPGCRCSAILVPDAIAKPAPPPPPPPPGPVAAPPPPPPPPPEPEPEPEPVPLPEPLGPPPGRPGGGKMPFLPPPPDADALAKRQERLGLQTTEVNLKPNVRTPYDATTPPPPGLATAEASSNALLQYPLGHIVAKHTRVDPAAFGFWNTQTRLDYEDPAQQGLPLGADGAHMWDGRIIFDKPTQARLRQLFGAVPGRGRAEMIENDPKMQAAVHTYVHEVVHGLTQARLLDRGAYQTAGGVVVEEGLTEYLARASATEAMDYIAGVPVDKTKVARGYIPSAYDGYVKMFDDLFAIACDTRNPDALTPYELAGKLKMLTTPGARLDVLAEHMVDTTTVLMKAQAAEVGKPAPRALLPHNRNRLVSIVARALRGAIEENQAAQYDEAVNFARQAFTEEILDAEERGKGKGKA